MQDQMQQRKKASEEAVPVVAPAAPVVRRSLVVGPAHDPSEREADSVADAVVRSLSSRQDVRRTASSEADSRIRRLPSAPSGAEVGLAGGEISPELTQRIRRSAGQGQPLDAAVRAPMESAFGADLGGVRIHTNSDVAPKIQAKAFTLGNDVHFAPGEYQPSTTSGQHTLAHELTHTLQQSGGAATGVERSVRRSPVKIQRKLTAENTKWANATTAYSSEGGGNGVLFVTDDPKSDPVVLKTGEDADVEAMVAARLHAEMFGDSGLGYQIKSPGVRVVLPDEAKGIGAALKDKVVANPKLKTMTPEESIARANSLIKGAAYAGTLVMEFAKGEDFKEKGEGKQTKKKNFFSSQRVAAKGSGLAMIQERGFAMGLGKTAAADIFTANFDRLVGLTNFENWKTDNVNTISLIDNVFMSDSGFNLRSMPQFKITRDSGEAGWMRHTAVGKLRGNDFVGLATPIASGIIRGLKKFAEARAESDSKSEQTKAQQEIALIEAAEKKLVKDLADGIRKGKDLLLKALANPAPLLKGIPPTEVDDVRLSIENRKRFLEGK